MFKIGFMQGRLSPKPADRIQAFPKDSWREEFARAKEIGFDSIELIYDELYLEENPLASDSGRRELKSLSKETGVELGSVCADYFMLHLLASTDREQRVRNRDKALALVEIANDIGCRLVEFPFVDASSLREKKEQDLVHESIEAINALAKTHKIRVALETDLAPVAFREFLKRFDSNVGANLDLGNSAALGFDPLAECRAYGERVFNVHIKDRVLGGTTVALQTGHTDFKRAFEGLALARYQGDFILQTAPSPDYLAAAAKYRELVREWSRVLCN